MCGRYASYQAEQDLADEFAIDAVGDDVAALPPSWNVAPTDGVRIVVERADRSTGEVTRRLQVARWGLVPSWAKDPSVGARMINARVETVAEKPAFARALAARRALLPADGYFEWQTRTTAAGRVTKQPFYIHRADGKIAALAGLYEFWRDRSRADDDPARWWVTATVLTRPAQQGMSDLHDRQPLILPRAAWARWLSPALTDVADLLRVDPPPLAWYPVGTAVNAVAHNAPDLLAPLPS